MLEKVSGYGTRGAQLYERLLRDEILKHIRNLDIKPAENAWTTHVSPERAAEASDAAVDRFSKIEGRPRNLGRRHLRGRDTRAPSLPSPLTTIQTQQSSKKLAVL